MSSPQQQQQQQQQGKASKRELQGPRPAPLKIWRDSHKIRKPPLPVPVPAIPHRPPVIIYAHSPEVIHTEAREFMTLVQRLTGRVNTHGNSSMPPSSSFTIQSPISHSLLHSQTSVPGNPNICQVDASPSPRGGGLDFLVKEYNSIVSSSNPSEFSGSNIQSRYPTPVQSFVSPSIQYGSMSPFSPNFFLPSPRMLSPNIFKEFPLCTPHAQPDYLYSPYRHLLRMQSDPIFTPNTINALPYLPSPPPTDWDLFNNSISG